MDEDSTLTQERKSESLSVRELQARLNGKLPMKKNDSDQDESTKSSIRSLDSNFDTSKEELSPIAKKISQFQSQNSLSGKGFLTHSRAGSMQPVPNASNQKPMVLPNFDITDNAKPQHQKGPSSDFSSQSSTSSPSVAALRSQLALSPAMFRPGDLGGIKSSKSIKSQSGDINSSSNESLSAIPKLDLEGQLSISTITTPKSSSRVSDIQQRLALDPNMLLPSPLSGPPSRSHRRGRSTASSAGLNPASEVSHDSQMNRPLIATRSRRCRTSTKFVCDDETVLTFEEVEKLTSQLESKKTVEEEKASTTLKVPVELSNTANIDDGLDTSMDVTEKTLGTNKGNCTIENILPAQLKVIDTTIYRALTQQQDLAEAMQAEAKQKSVGAPSPKVNQDQSDISGQLNTDATIP